MQYSKFYPFTAEQSAFQAANRAFLGPKCHSLGHLGNGCYLMMRHLTRMVEIGILLRRDFLLLQPHLQEDTEKLNLEHPDPKKIDTTAGKLRWYRQRKALRQREVAAFAGLDRSTYIHYEKTSRDYYPPDKLEKIAQLLEVDLLELMDGYNLFLYHDQGRQIRAKREALGMTTIQYAKYLGVQTRKLYCWESNQVQISKATWERYFK